MNGVLGHWNEADVAAAVVQILPCCGSTAWAREMAARRPMLGEAALIHVANDIWSKLPAHDWQEALRSHPRIGDSAITSSATNSAIWAKQEQNGIAQADEEIKLSLAEGNRNYEKKFGHIFIVYATGKSAPEMLEILNLRMHNDPQTELREAAEQQRQIMQIRLKKWLQG